MTSTKKWVKLKLEEAKIQNEIKPFGKSQLEQISNEIQLDIVVYSKGERERENEFICILFLLLSQCRKIFRAIK